MKRYVLKLDPKYDPQRDPKLIGPVEPGCWWPVFENEGRLSARITCPWCGTGGYLDHDIDDEGNVMPSCVCPNHSKCPWHVFLVLDGWAGALLTS